MKTRLAAAAASVILPSVLLLPTGTASASAQVLGAGGSATASAGRATGRVAPSDESLATLGKNSELRRFVERQGGSGDVRAQADEDPAPTGATIVSPATGTNVAGDFQLTVNRGGAVYLSVWVDGEQVRVDGGTDETVVFDLNLIGPASGRSYKIEVGDCPTGYCLPEQEGVEVTDSITVTAYPELGIDVTSASSSGYFSPDGDGVKDAVTIYYTTQVAGTVKATVTRVSDGSVVRTVNIGSKAAGSASFSWNGKTGSGGAALNGGYRVDVSVATSGGSISKDGVNVVLDTIDPTLSSLAKSDSKVFPRKDNYRDSVTFSGKLSENASLVQLRITNSSGKTVRTLSAKSVSGTVKLAWNGRTSSGKLLAKGTYKYRWTATDLAGNVRSTSAGSVVVDNRILKKKVATKTVTPKSVKFDSYIGSCAKLVKNPNGWSGAHQYKSGCAFVEGSSIGQVWVFYKLTLPKAVKYGTVRIGALGKAHPFKVNGNKIYSYAGLTQLGLNSDKEWYAASSKDLAPSYKTYWTSSRSLSSLGLGRKVVWEAGTNNGNRYDVRKFKVKWSYYVLVN